MMKLNFRKIFDWSIESVEQPTGYHPTKDYWMNGDMIVPINYRHHGQRLRRFYNFCGYNVPSSGLMQRVTEYHREIMGKIKERQK